VPKVDRNHRYVQHAKLSVIINCNKVSRNYLIFIIIVVYFVDQLYLFLESFSLSLSLSLPPITLLKKFFFSSNFTFIILSAKIQPKQTGAYKTTRGVSLSLSLFFNFSSFVSVLYLVSQIKLFRVLSASASALYIFSSAR